jgi:hypothetical protein
MQHHVDNHNARHPLKGSTVVEGADLFLEESYVTLNQFTVLQSRRPIHAGHCGETYHHVTDGGKFVVTFYHHNSKAMEEIHLVRCL